MNTCMHVHSYAKEELCEAVLISAQLLLLYTIIHTARRTAVCAALFEQPASR